MGWLLISLYNCSYKFLYYVHVDIFTQLLININIPYTKNTNNKNISKKQTFSIHKFDISLKKKITFPPVFFGFFYFLCVCKQVLVICRHKLHSFHITFQEHLLTCFIKKHFMNICTLKHVNISRLLGKNNAS